jgi:multiple sugar transport system substrate-binding protein
MAQAVFASIPIFIVYILFQKQIVARWRERPSGGGSSCLWRAPRGKLQQRRRWRRSGREIYLQRFFGECGAEYGSADRRFEGRGRVRDHHRDDQQVQRAESGRPRQQQRRCLARLSAAFGADGAKDPPDLVTMHTGVISDYAAEGLLEPIEPYLAAAGLSPAALTDASRSAASIGERIYGLPFDSHGGLFHINTKLFAQAGLMRGGKPVLPTSPEEMLAHARQFTDRTASPI